MKRFILGVGTAAALLQLGACGKPADLMVSAETLVADPQRLKELRAQCKADRAKVGDAQCAAVAEATRRRFAGTGTPYMPGGVLPSDPAGKD
jgi:conjugal transfer/entry exclusion protein